MNESPSQRRPSLSPAPHTIAGVRLTNRVLAVCRHMSNDIDGTYSAFRTAKALGMDLGFVTKAFKVMRRDGWLELESQEPVHGRTFESRALYRLTGHGRAELVETIARSEGRAETKHCRRCRTTKSRLEFARCKRNMDGLAHWCKSCYADVNFERSGTQAEDLPADYRKACTKCRRDLPAVAFHRARARPDGLGYQCRECVSEYNKGRTEQRRANARFKNYALTAEAFAALVRECDGCCGVCGVQMVEGLGWKSLHIDHDHGCCPGTQSCGQCVRGLLCGRCNLIIGKFESTSTDMVEWAISATRYVQSRSNMREAKSA